MLNNNETVIRLMFKWGYIGSSILFLLLLQNDSFADIFFWEDENGVRRYSNTSPPPQTSVQRQAEIPFDEAAYEARRAYEAQAQAERRIRLERERNARLQQQVADTHKRLAELERKADKALNAATSAARKVNLDRVKQRRILHHPRWTSPYGYKAPYPGLKRYPGLKPYPGLAPYPGLRSPDDRKIPKRFRALP